MFWGWKSRSVSKFHFPRLPQLSNFLQENRAPRNFIKFNNSKPHRMVIKGTSPKPSPKSIQDELHAIGLQLKISYRWPPGEWRLLYISVDDRILKVPQSHRISESSHLFYIKVRVNSCKGRAVQPLCSVSKILSRGRVLSGFSGLRPLWRRALLVAVWVKMWRKSFRQALCARYDRTVKNTQGVPPSQISWRRKRGINLRLNN